MVRSPPPQSPRSSVVTPITHYSSSGTQRGYQLAARIFTPSFPIPLPTEKDPVTCMNVTLPPPLKVDAFDGQDAAATAAADPIRQFRWACHLQQGGYCSLVRYDGDSWYWR